jgi:hypothetical protein
MRRRISIILLLALLRPACGDGVPLGGPPVPPVVGSGLLPAGLPNHLAIGLGNFDIGPGTWISASGVAWKYRYQYLSGGVDPGKGWSTWNTPAGDFALRYMNKSLANGMIPVFDYYQIRESSPNAGSEDPDSKLQNPTTMNRYFGDFKLLMDQCKTFNNPVIVHIEPDFWGFCQNRHGDDPSVIPVAVAASGFADAAGFPNNLPGFAQALVHLRDVYASNALIALHASHWGAGGDLILNQLNADNHAIKTGGFFNALGANFELLFHDPTDRDAGYKQFVYLDGGASWWDDSDFTRYHDYLLKMWTVTGRRGMLWQLPIGNTVSPVCNDTDYHYRDNRAEYFLLAANRTHLTNFANAGVIALLYGTPEAKTTHFEDIDVDGVDDDGGFLRTSAGAYYSAPQVQLP